MKLEESVLNKQEVEEIKIPQSKTGQLVQKLSDNDLSSYKDEKLRALAAAGANASELNEYYKSIELAKYRQLTLRVGFGLSAIMAITGSAILITGASLIAGLGLLGIGAASAGASFVIASGGVVAMGDFGKVIRDTRGQYDK